MLVKLADSPGVSLALLLTLTPVEDSPEASLRLFQRFKVLEALAAADRETVSR
jgi:hypothetical protein